MRPYVIAAGAALLAVMQPAGAVPKAAPLRFGKPVLVDPNRAGGEPTVIALPNGDLLYAAHAQLSHYYAPNGVDPMALTPHRGQAYMWRSSDRGRTWTEVTLAATGLGGSDPDFTLDAAGNVYFAEITPAQVSVAKSSDAGRTWTATPLAAAVYDREWLAGGAANELYMSGKLGLDVIPAIYRSTDGGVTWTPQGVDDAGEYPINKLWYDRRAKALYHSYTTGSFGAASHDIGVSVSRDQGKTWTHRRAGTVERLLDISAPPMTVDRSGVVYATLPSTNAQGHTALRVVSSRNGGATWSKPITLASTGGVLFPWLVAGDPGRFAAAWLCADRPVTDTETQPAAWSLCAAVVTGADTSRPVVHRTRLTGVVHHGVVCVQGVTCEAVGIDRRLGEFITLAVDNDGSLLVAYSDTWHNPKSAVARPGFVRQASGPRLYARP